MGSIQNSRLSLALVLIAPSALAQPLNGALERLIAEQKLSQAEVSVFAVDLASRSVLTSIRPGAPMIPASNMKLLTSGVALDVLGGDFAFRTEIALAGTTVILRGSGDPSFGTDELLRSSEPRMTVPDFLARLAVSVKDAGPAAVDAVIVDERVFDRQLVHPAWEPDDLTKAYAAPICGLNFHANVVTVYPAPAASGRAPTVVIEPESPWIDVVNRARSVGKGGGSCWITRDANEEVFTLFGEVSRRVAIEVALHDPARSAGRLLAAELLDAGLRVAGATAGERDALERAYSVVRVPRADETLPAGRTVVVITAPIADVLRRCNADSSNLDAECLLKRVGHEVTGAAGSWANGASVVRMRLAERLGPEFAAETAVSDGSGLSRENRVSARTLGRWLEAMASGAHADLFIESLAMPGEGTLRRRFRDGSVSLTSTLCAKSGSIDGVRCLSGYLLGPGTAQGGEPRVAFSILVNGLKGSETQAALKFHEQAVAELDRWLRDAAAPVRDRKGG